MLLSIGEILLDTFIKEDEKGYEATFRLGGAPFNLAARVALRGIPSSFYGAIGEDVFGKMVLKETDKYPLSTCFLKRLSKKHTTLAVVSLQNGERSFEFMREDKTDSLLDMNDLKQFPISHQDIVHFGSLLLSEERGYRFMKAAIAYLKPFSPRFSFDLNVRPKAFLESDELILKRYLSILKEMDYVKASEEDFRWLTSLEPLEFKEKHLKEGSLLFLTYGANGSEVYFGEGRSVFVPSQKVKAVDTTGAGDAFYSSVLASLLKNPTPSDFNILLEEANREGALATTYKGALPKTK